MASRVTADDGNPTIGDARFRMRCWGDFAITDAVTHADLKPRGRKARALLAYLALHPGKPVSRERLTGLLWGDRADEQARASLRQAIFELKAFTNGNPALLNVARDHITLNSDALATDIDEMRTAAQNEDHDVLIAALPDENERLFGNMDGIDSGFDDWLRGERTRQHDAMIARLADASAKALVDGQVSQARALHVRLGAFDPDCAPLPTPPPPRPAHDGQSRQQVAAIFGGDNRIRRTAFWVATPFAALALAIGVWQSRSPNPTVPMAIAVLPFKDLSGRSEPYFAEGLSEEILGQLSRNTGLKVLGRTSAWSFQGMKLDAPTLGRKLDVDYLVEGSVRSSGDRVRIDVSLVRAKDGTQMWSQRFDGALGDMFAIQDKIGAAVADRLDLGDPAQVAANPAPVTRGDVYSLYLTARGLIRDREPAKMDTAVELLRRAAKIDPDYAPVRANLGLALHFQLGFMINPTFPKARIDAINAEALDNAKAALRLNPNLADASLAYGVVLSGMSGHNDESRRAIERAAQLDPNSAEVWNTLAQSYDHTGEYTRELDGWRHAVAIDPLWWRAFYNASEMAWEMGYLEESVAISKRVEKDGVPMPFLGMAVRGDMAWRRGEISGEYRYSQAARETADQGRRMFADWGKARALRALGYLPEARHLWGFYSVDDAMWRMWHNLPPPPSYVRALHANPGRAWDDGIVMTFLLRTLVNAGRSPEVVALYDMRFKTADTMLDHPNGHAAFLQDAVPVALALRNVGRGSEAHTLLGLADREMRKRLAKGRVPRDYLALCAQVWAAKGDHAAALTVLEKLTGTGWLYTKAGDSLTDIAQEPAFHDLIDDPRFESIRRRMKAKIDSERRKLGPISPQIS